MSPARLNEKLDYYERRGVAAVEYDFWVAPGDRLLRVRCTVRGASGAVVTTTDIAEGAEPAEGATDAPAEAPAAPPTPAG